MRLRTLGGLELEGSDFQRPKPLLLLAYLALEGPQERRHLAELFWPGSLNALASLGTTLTRLRQGTDGRVEADEVRAWCRLPCDAVELQAALASGAPADAVALYRGRFLDGFYLKDLGEELEEWVYRRRELLAAGIRGALLRLAEQDALHGAFEAAAARAEEAYLLAGAPEPEAEAFRRIYRLLRAGDSPRTAEVHREAEEFGLPLDLTRDQARAELAEAHPEPLLRAENPYKGLAFFQEEDAAYYFGRDHATGELSRDVVRQACTVLVGSSGSGKSSLVFAGLVPELRRQGGWQIAHLRPGRVPLRALAAALLPLLEPGLGRTDRLLEAKRLAEGLHKGDLALTEVVEQILRESLETRLLLVIDQFEELYTLERGAPSTEDAMPRSEAAPAAAEPFLDQLLNALRAAGDRFRLLLIVRADFLAALLAYRPLLDVVQRSQYLLGAMSEEELRAAIEKPAQAHGVRFEEGLVDRILDDVSGREGNLPLLEFALTQLWERQQGGRLTHEAYDALGGVEQALANHAEQVLAGFDEREREAAQKLFLQLVRPGEGQEDARRVAPREEIGEERWALMSRLASARLVVTGQDETGAQTAELAHEALIRRWDALRAWLNEHRAFRIWQERLRQGVRVWLASNRDRGALLRGFYLEEARQQLGEYGEQLGGDERAFIEASLALEEEQQAEARRQQEERDRSRRERERLQRLNIRRLRIFLALVAVLALLAGWQWRLAGRERDRSVQAEEAALAARSATEEQRDLATRQAELALMRQLGAQALAAAQLPGPATGTFDTALLLARQGIRLVEGAESYGNLLRVLQNKPAVTTLSGHAGFVESLAFSPDGRTLVTASVDQSVRFWDVIGGRPVGAPIATGSLERIWTLGSDGRLLAVVGFDGTISLWDLEARKPSGVPIGKHPAVVASIALSPDGGLLASGGSDGSVVLWDLRARTRPGLSLRGHLGAVTALSFSPDGRLLASGGADATVRLWDAAAGAPLGDPLRGHGDAVSTLAFSPDGKTLASGGLDRTVRLWDVNGGSPAGGPLRHTAPVRDVAFGPDGRSLASAFGNDTVLLWDVATREAVGAFRGEDWQDIFTLAFSPDGRTLAIGAGAVGGADPLALWDVAPLLGTTFRGHRDWVWSVAFRPDGNLLASGDDGGRVLLRDAGSGSIVGELFQGRGRAALSLAFSPDGDVLAVGRRDDAIQLWNVDDPAPLGEPLRGHTGDVLSVAFSPDGTLLASGGQDGAIRLWEVVGQKASGEPWHASSPVRSVAFGPDGKILAAGGQDGTVVLWDVASGTPLGEPLAGHRDAVTGVAFSPDGKLLASSSWDRDIVFWDVASGDPRGVPLRAHRGRVWSVAFSPDGKLLASAGEDGSVLLWDLASRTQLGEFRGHDDWVLTLAFVPDGHTLASAGRDAAVRLWDVDVGSWLETACRLAGRNLSREEWQRHLGDRPYETTCPEYPAGE